MPASGTPAARLSDADFKRAEDRAVDDAIALQERAGIDVLTDGEQRRNVFASQIVQAAAGFESVGGNEVDWFRLDGTVERSPVTVAVTGKIRLRRRFCTEELTCLRARTAKPVKATVPSPTMYAYWAPGISDGAYPSPQAYLEDVTDLASPRWRRATTSASTSRSTSSSSSPAGPARSGPSRVTRSLCGGAYLCG
jgi:5-methyltetrahydropteroyltriglutamate--homocysteine methyltransferase